MKPINEKINGQDFYMNGEDINLNIVVPASHRRTLSPRDSEALLELIENPPEPSKYSLEAMKRFRARQKSHE